MTRIPLSISSGYVDWEWWHAIRELFQNGMDAHERGQKLSYAYIERTQQLVIKNDGARLSRDSLVLGTTSKRNDLSQRGEFGEGYKLACATICRLGAKVAIYNGKEYWRPELAYSELFKTEVLHFSIQEMQNEHQLMFVITGVPKNEWELAKSRLLFLHSPSPDSMQCPYGRLLLEGAHAGNLYVKGIFVTSLPDKHRFGYDLYKIKLDRDRRSPDVYSLRYAIISIIKHLVESGLLLPSIVLDTLELCGGETLAFDHDYGSVTEFHKRISDAFDSKYGANSIPVASFEESTRARDFALDGIVVNAPLLRLLRKTKSSLDRLLASKILSVAKTWSVSELSEGERRNLRWAINLSSKVESLDLKKIFVVDFVGDKLWGKFESDGCMVYIAKKILVNKSALLATVIHELCHKYGPDGHQSHRDAVEDRLARIAILLSGDGACE